MTRIQRLGDVAQIVPGFAFGETFQGRTNLPTPFIKVSDFAAATNSWLSTAVNAVNRDILQSLRARTYPPGTVIFPKVGGALLTNKRARLAVEATFDNNVMGLVPTDVDGDYLFYFMCSVDMSGLANTQAIPSVRGSDVACIEIPVPPFHEQRRIAAHLKNQLAAVQEARQAAQAQTKEVEALVLAIYRDAFADIVPVGMPSVCEVAPENWRWAKLSDLARLESGHTPSRSRSDWWGGNTSWVSLTEIRSLDGRWVEETAIKTNVEGIANSAARILPRGTVCFSRTASVGFVTIMGQPMATSQDFANWVCGDDLEPEFLMHALIRSRNELRALATGATHKTIYMPTLEEFHLYLPERDVQELIVKDLKAKLAAVDQARQSAQMQFEEIEVLPARLLAQTFEEQH
jgi:type I restriction enzyme, S subunit